jgi:hypothetical protein
MEDKTLTINYDSDISDESIHRFAVYLLLSRYDSELILNQGKYKYWVRGGKSGHLYYRKQNSEKWVLIAIWCVYGLYMVIRYRKPVWLRPMYRILFTKMNFVSVIFDEYSIELVDAGGQMLKNRKFRLSPPLAFGEVMSKQFNFSEDKIHLIKSEMGLDW